MVRTSRWSWALAVAGCAAQAEPPPLPPLPVDTSGGCAEVSWYLDGDADGYGDDATERLACADQGTDGEVDRGGDCDDSDPGSTPGLAEVPYDGADNDCDPATPDDDLDGDGYAAADDCADDDGAVHPGATDAACTGVDADCDGHLAYCELHLDEVGTVLWGAGDLDGLGWGLAIVGDTDGDGFDDLVVSAHAVDAERGAAYLVRGPIAAGGDVTTVAAATWSGPGETLLGRVVAAAGDTSGDGLADVWVADTEGAFLFEGPFAGAYPSSSAVAYLAGGSSSGEPTGLTADQDLTGDGIADVLRIGLLGAYLVPGPFTGSSDIESASRTKFANPAGDCVGLFGMIAEVLGDMDGDGVQELYVGVDESWPDCTDNWGSGVIVGSDLVGIVDTRTEADARLLSVMDDVVGPGDWDGDGYADLAVNQFNEGLLVVPGPIAGPFWAEVDATYSLALDGLVDGVDMKYLAAVGDIDGDGFPDIGGVGFRDVADYDPMTGFFIRGGQSGAWSADDLEWQLSQPVLARNLAFRVGSGGDVDGDGSRDLVYADALSTGHTGGGVVWVVPGSLF